MAEELYTDLWHLTLQFLDVQTRHRSHKTEVLESLEPPRNFKRIGQIYNLGAAEKTHHKAHLVVAVLELSILSNDHDISLFS